MEVCEHLACEVGRAGSACDAELDVLVAYCGEDGGDFIVEAVAAAVCVADGVAGVSAACLRPFEWWVDVCVYPERPESVV